MKAYMFIFTVLSMLFPLLQLYGTSKEPRNGVYEKQGKISFPEGTPSIGPFHVHFVNAGVLLAYLSARWWSGFLFFKSKKCQLK